MALKKLSLIVGARPNFMKAAPLLKELLSFPDKFETTLIHTGQHYDDNLSKFFFDDLKIPKPDIHLGAGSGTHAQQTAKVMVDLETEFEKSRPDLVIVFGDINSTIAAALVTAKMGIKLCHVEAGLRSFDMSMPEEINRLVTDQLSELMFVTEQVGIDNLNKEGLGKRDIHLVGNLMIDSLISCLPLCEKSNVLDRFLLTKGGYVAMTLHRPVNVDDEKQFRSILNIVSEISKHMPVIFPCHPRTKARIESFGIDVNNSMLKIIDPLGYLDFLKLVKESKLVISDSGGIQADASYLGIPCLTLRDTTEQPITIEQGTNTLCHVDRDKILSEVDSVLNGTYKKGGAIDLWDGKTAERIVKKLY